MALTPGTALGPYEIVAPIGQGGMGEVYSATDTRLDRTVAIKVLPAELASDPDRRERFEREAKAIAALNHPHICTLHDVGHEDGTDFLVMEHLEGESLQDRLTKGAVPLEQALQIAIQIADALDKAHRQGITHRDLKPGNIFLTKSGAKLLDFGLAKLKDVGAVGNQSTKLADGLTAQGTILGTFHYMAPEQLEGGEADARSDIWAFGCVVYEMVTGQKAFEGKSQASLIAAIIEREPATLSSVEPLSPTGLDYVVTACLEKSPDDRWQTARDLLRELKRVAPGGSVAIGVEQTGVPPPLAVWPRPAIALLAGLAIAVLTGLSVWSVMRSQDAVRPVARTRRFTVPIPGVRLHATPAALSPDGRTLAVVACTGPCSLGPNRLAYRRSLDALAAEPIPGTEGATSIFFSPDGAWLGVATDQELKKVPLGGGPAVILYEGPTRQATWSADGTIIFSRTSSGILRVSAAGGEVEDLTTFEPASASSHMQPQLLPGGKGVLFVAARTGSAANMEITVASRGSDTSKILAVGTSPHYVSTGHVVFHRDGSLWALPFDPDRLEALGQPVRVLDGVGSSGSSVLTGLFTIHADGSLIYLPGGFLETSARRLRLVWVDRQGHETALGAEPGNYRGLEISPDGRRVALDDRGTSDVWVWDVAVKAMNRLTFDPGNDGLPLWSPDGGRLLFESHRGGQGNIYVKSADGTGSTQRLTDSPKHQVPKAITPDGRWLVVEERSGSPTVNLSRVSLAGAAVAEPLVGGTFNVSSPDISPDGGWMAYRSDETGQSEIYLRPFPDVESGRWQVSTEGGRLPRWGPDGRELFYRSLDGTQVSMVGIRTDPSVVISAPEALFERPYLASGDLDYDIAPDGQRFLMLGLADDKGPIAERADLVFVENWLEELKARVPVN